MKTLISSTGEKRKREENGVIYGDIILLKTEADFYEYIFDVSFPEKGAYRTNTYRWITSDGATLETVWKFIEMQLDYRNYK